MSTDKLPCEVRIHGPGDKVVGAGILVDRAHVITCAHVVDAALGRATGTGGRPGKDRAITLDFPDARQDNRLFGKVAPGGWTPVAPDGRGDVAVLELTGGLPPGARPARLRSSKQLKGHSFDVRGFPPGRDGGVTARGTISRRAGPSPGREWYQLDGRPAESYQIGRGFSGAGVWDNQLNAVVGMVVADDRSAGPREAFMVPASVLADYWSPLGCILNARRRRWRWAAVAVVLVAVGLPTSVLLTHRPNTVHPRPPGAGPAATSPTSSQPGPQTTTTPAPTTIGPVSLGRAAITAIRSADGLPGYSGDLLVDVRVNAARSGRSLFLVSDLHQHGTAVPNPVYAAKASIPARPGQYEFEAIFHYSSASIGLVRTFMVVSADRAATKSLQDNLAHQSDTTWDPNRVRLPPGATVIATFPPIVRNRQ
jgi:hypothetical protein